MNKTLRLTFVASIVLNVLFLGVLLGELPKRFETRASRQQKLDTFAQQLPEPERARFRAEMAEIRKETDPLRAEIQKTRDETIAIFVADRFDEAAYDRQVTKISELRLQLSKRLAASMKEVAKELAPAERKALAQVFERPPRGR